MEVFKVCLVVDDKYLSLLSLPQGTSCRYELRKTTKPKPGHGPMFAYYSKSQALDVFSDAGLVVFRCTAEVDDRSVRRRLPIAFKLTANKLKEHWAKPNLSNTYKVPSYIILCKSITPLEVIT